jgi:hypothetical protein
MKRVLSYGAGLDSFAMLVEALRRGDRPDVVAFVDVSNGTIDRDPTEPGEWPGTYRHMREVVIPLCKQAGIEFEWLDSTRFPVRDASSLFSWLRARQQIPVAGPNRICTRIAKVERFEAWLASRWPEQIVEVWIGFEAGEEARAEKDPNAGKPNGLRKNRFPLMEWGLCRCRCEALVRAAGYPVPRKSACVFCPYGTKGDWQTLARELPTEFEATAELERVKPPTSKGKKLSIMGYRTLKDRNGVPTGEYRAPPLQKFIEGTYRPKAKVCEVCHGPRATKATGCDYLPPAAS